METSHLLMALDVGTSSIKYMALPVNGGPQYAQIVTGAIDACYRPLSDHDVEQSWDTLKKPVRGQYGTSARQAGGGLHRSANIYDTDAYRVYCFAAIAEALNALKLSPEHVIIDEIGIGFPISHERRAASVADLLLHEGDSWDVAMAGMRREYAVSIASVYAQTQPYYAALDHVYQWQGGPFQFERGKALFRRGGFLMIEAGSNSLDFRYQVGSLASAGQFVVMKGSFSLLDALKSVVFDRLAYNPQDHELMHDVLKTGTLFYDGEFHDFSQEIRELVAAQWRNGIQADIETGMASLPSIPATVLMAGGGAYHGVPAFQALYPKRFRYGVQMAVDDFGKPEGVYRVVNGILKQLVVNAGKRERGEAYGDIRYT